MGVEKCTDTISLPLPEGNTVNCDIVAVSDGIDYFIFKKQFSGVEEERNKLDCGFFSPTISMSLEIFCKYPLEISPLIM